jgi:two-component system LytT family response regulator
VFIADAERSSRARLRRLLEREAGIDLLGECSHARYIAAALHAETPDILFLSLKLPGLQPSEILRLFAQRRPLFCVLLARSDSDILRSIAACGAEHLLHPFDAARLRSVLEQARLAGRDHKTSEPVKRRVTSSPNSGDNDSSGQRLALNSSGKISFLKLEEIEWIRGAHNYAELHTATSVHLARKTITALEEQLPAGRFLRISRSLLVNLDRIRELRRKSHGDYVVVLQNGTELKGSRGYRENLRGLPGVRLRGADS